MKEELKERNGIKEGSIPSKSMYKPHFFSQN